ncbi:hypothetical protein XO08_07695 [Thermosipho sp. 1074]|nr:hypothetical protein XO08_07695 [Thermosipho sp. 1074]
MGNLRERLKQLRVEKGLTQYDMAKKLNIARSTYANWEQGTTSPSDEFLAKLAEILETSVDYLVGNTDIKEPAEEILRKMGALELIRRIPVVGKVAAGQPTPAEENIEGYIVLPEGMSGDFGLIITGDSMEPRLSDGDIAIIKKQEILNNGEVGVFLVNGQAEGIVKQFYKYDNYVMLKSLNDNYEPLIISAKKWDRECRIIGKVVGKLERW